MTAKDPVGPIRPGPLNLITDVPGLKVGNAVDAEIGTGATVVLPDRPLVCAADVRGGAPGTQQVSLIAPENIGGHVDALVLSGGSLFGLAAAAGVTSALGAAGQGTEFLGYCIPTVPAAIIFDLAAQRRGDWLAAPPYERLGREAVAAAAHDFPLGTVGAGTGASACSWAGGLGSASAVRDDGLIVGALAVVNSFGEVAVPGARSFWAWPFEFGDEFGGLGAPDLPAPIAVELTRPARERKPGMSTTLVVVAANVALSQAEAKRLAIMAQDGLSRAIRPVHTLLDGDVVFALGAGERPAGDAFEQARLGALAADVVARAIARAVWHAGPHRTLPAVREAWT